MVSKQSTMQQDSWLHAYKTDYEWLMKDFIISPPLQIGSREIITTYSNGYA